MELTVTAPARKRAVRAAQPPGADFWALPAGRLQGDPKGVVRLLADRLNAAPATALFEALETGVPSAMVNVIAGATGEPVARVAELVGVPATTLRRKSEAGERLPDAAGHRVMAWLRIVATLRRLLAESGDADALKSFDVEAWAEQWIRTPLPQLGGRAPADMLRNPEGMRAVEQALERMRGGLVA